MLSLAFHWAVMSLLPLRYPSCAALLGWGLRTWEIPRLAPRLLAIRQGLSRAKGLDERWLGEETWILRV